MSAFLNKENVTNLIKENTFLKGGGSCIYLKFQIFLSLFLINRDWFQHHQMINIIWYFQ